MKKPSAEGEEASVAECAPGPAEVAWAVLDGLESPKGKRCLPEEALDVERAAVNFIASYGVECGHEDDEGTGKADGPPEVADLLRGRDAEGDAEQDDGSERAGRFDGGSPGGFEGGFHGRESMR